jgi:excisionase family DNA binding protein
MTTPTSSAVSTRLFTIREAAEVLKIHASWLYERTRRNAIPCHRLGKHLRFTGEDLARILAAQDSMPQSRQ